MDLSFRMTNRVKKLHVRLGTYRVPSDDAAESHTLVAWADAFPVRARADVSARRSRPHLETYRIRRVRNARVPKEISRYSNPAVSCDAALSCVV